jgi:capsular exopolysaccharide synthesis family protein
MDRSMSSRITQRVDAGPVDAPVPVRADAMPLPGDPGEAPPRADLHAYWRALVRYRWPILGFAAASTLLAAIAVSLATPVYRASTLVLVEAQERRTVSIDSVYSGVSPEREHLQTQVELVASRDVLLGAVRALRLADRPEHSSPPAPGRLQRWLGRSVASPAQSPPRSRAEIEERIADGIRLGLSVSPVKLSRLIQISYRSADPQLAAAVANEIARAYIRADVEARKQITEATGEAIRDRLGLLKTRVDAAEQAAQAYREREGLIESKAGASGVTPKQLEELTLRLADARYRRIVAEQAWEQVRPQGADPAMLPLVQRDPEVQRARQRVDDARRRVGEASQQFGTGHPTYLAAAADLERALATLQRESRTVIEGLRRDWTAALATERALEASISQVKQVAQGTSRKELALQELEREVAANRQVYQAFLLRLRETSATLGGEQPSARIVESASVPRSPVSPRKPQTLLIVLIGSLALGIVAALLGRRLDTVLRTVGDVESRLGQSVLAAVPPLKSRSRIEAANAAVRQPDTPFAEAIGTAATGLLLSTLEDERKVVVIASSTSGEGKSLIALNLAMFQAQEQRVLLIEGDLRQPRLRSVLGLERAQPGLSELIVGLATPEQAIVAMPDSGLDVIVAGRVPRHPLHLLRSPRFAELIESMRDRYDVVVIDTPPLQHVSDGLVAGRLASGCVLVAAAGTTPVPVARASVRRIQAAGIPLLGVVLNHYDVDKARVDFGERGVQGLEPYGRLPGLPSPAPTP